MSNAERRLQREVNDLNDLRSVMDHLRDIRDRESGIQMEIAPVTDMYVLLLLMMMMMMLLLLLQYFSFFIFIHSGNLKIVFVQFFLFPRKIAERR